ncbi:MAG: hypothetical protein ACREHV_17325 [Rhizomicrobium sp.]
MQVHAGAIRAILERLARIHSYERRPADALGLILWENIGYLIDDARRETLLAEFGARVGFGAAEIARAPHALLLDIARRGGMRPETRVERWLRVTDGHAPAKGFEWAVRSSQTRRTMLNLFASRA